MKRYAGEVWISYDGDSAGRKAALRALDMLSAAGLHTKVIDYPGGMDPDDFVKANGLAGFEALRKIDGIEYRMIRAKDDLDITTQDGMTQYAMRSCQIIRTVKNPVEAENYLRKLAHETGYDREILARQVGATANPVELKPRQQRREGEKVAPSKAEGSLIAMLSGGMIPSATVAPEDFDSPVNARAAKWLIEGRPIRAYVDSLDDAARAQLMADMNSALLPEDPAQALDMARDLLKSIREKRRLRRIDEIKEELKTADEAQKKELMAHLSTLLREMRN